MAAKKPQPLRLADAVNHSLRKHSGRNERLYVRENSSDPKLRGAIVDELASLAEASIKHKDAQRQRAQKPRGVGDDGRTARQVVADVVKGHDIEAKPDDLLPHVHAALDANGNKAITDKWARELIRLELIRLGRSSKQRT